MNIISYNQNSIISTGNISKNSTLNQTLYNVTLEDDILEIPQKFGLPTNFPNIIGRDEEVDELYEKVFTQRQRVAITGIGGIGKTFLSLHCAKRWSPDSNNIVKHILFFNCQTEDTFKDSLNILARILKIKTSDVIGVLETFRQIYSKLDRDKCLLIYDNIDSYDIIRNYLPPVEKENLFVIVTSQIQKWSNLLKPYRLEMMKPEAAKEFIKSKLNDEYKNEITEYSIIDLLRTFNGYPLGLTHAMSFINNELDNDFNKYNVNEIIENYVNEISSNLGNDPPETSDDIYRKSVKAAILKNFEKICEDKYFEKNPHVKKMIDKITEFISFCNPDLIFIGSFDIVGFKIDIKSDEIEEILRIFVKWSIANVMKAKRIIKNKIVECNFLNVHRTVQTILKDTYENKQVVGIICGFINDFEYVECYSQLHFWCSHVNKNIIFECDEDEWSSNCKLLVSTPKIGDFVKVVINELVEGDDDKWKEYLEFFCQFLMCSGNVYIYKIFVDARQERNEIFVETFKRILESNDSSLTMWDREICVLESKLECLGLHFGQFDYTYNYWGDKHWFAWWNWIEKLKEYKIEDMLSLGWGNWTVIHVGALKGNIEILKLIPEEKLKEFTDIGVGWLNGQVISMRALGTLNAIEIASYFQYSEFLKILIDSGWSVNISNRYPSHVLKYISDFEIAKLLINHGADVDKLNFLSKAIECGQIEVLKILFNRGVDQKSLNEFEKSVIYFLVQAGVIDKDKISFDFDMEEFKLNKKFILHWAVKNGCIQLVRLLLEHDFDVNQTSDFQSTAKNSTALHFAVMYSKLEITQILLKNGAEINFKNKNGNTPLHFAVEQPDVDIVKLLLDYNAGINIVNMYNQNPLIMAVKFGNFQIVKLLLEKGSDVNLIDRGNYNALQHAVSEGYFDIVKLLLDYGSNVNSCYKNTESPLLMSVSYDIYAVKLLIDYKADVNLQSLAGLTALHRSGLFLKKDITELLLENGAKINLANIKGETVLIHVLKNRQFARLNVQDRLKLLEFIKMLHGKGADVDAIDNEGKKAIDWSDRLELYEISKYLHQYTTDQRNSYYNKKLFNNNNSSFKLFKFKNLISLLVIILAVYVYSIL